MDQFAIGIGKEHHAALLNCQTLDYTHTVRWSFRMLANTNKRRGQ